jgi:hypothetical protein
MPSAALSPAQDHRLDRVGGSVRGAGVTRWRRPGSRAGPESAGLAAPDADRLGAGQLTDALDAGDQRVAARPARQRPRPWLMGSSSGLPVGSAAAGAATVTTASGYSSGSPSPRWREVAGQHLGGGQAAVGQLARQRQRLQVGVELEREGVVAQSRPRESARRRCQLCLVHSWNSAAASEAVIRTAGDRRNRDGRPDSRSGLTLAWYAAQRYQTTVQLVSWKPAVPPLLQQRTGPHRPPDQGPHPDEVLGKARLWQKTR